MRGHAETLIGDNGGVDHPVTFEATAFWLLFSGVGLELVGAVLTIFDVRGRLKGIRKMERTPTAVYASADIHAGSTVTASQIGGSSPELTVEQRLAAAEKRLAGIRSEIDKAVQEQTQRTDQRISRAVGDAERTLQGRLNVLQDALTRTQGGRIRPYVGPMLIVAGFLVQAVGSCVQLLQ